MEVARRLAPTRSGPVWQYRVMASSVDRETGSGPHDPVTIRPMPDALGAAGVHGFFGGFILASTMLVVPTGPWWAVILAFFAVWFGLGSAIALLSWNLTALRFETDKLVITGLLGEAPTRPMDAYQIRRRKKHLR